MTKELYPYDRMFSPIQVNSITLKNRIVMAPMGNIDMCEETGRPNDKMLQYFFARAKGGVGLITTGLVRSVMELTIRLRKRTIFHTSRVSIAAVLFLPVGVIWLKVFMLMAAEFSYNLHQALDE
jgi:hypothetical protein